jgi:hypothetical protein
MQYVDLLTPSANYRNNYISQIQNTIDAYPNPSVVLGEAIQNSIDAICDNRQYIQVGTIDLEIDVDNASVTVKDNGCGFPRNISLLFLGGGTKSNLQNRKGKIGVGIKVCLFSSCYFSIRSNCGNNQTMWLEIQDGDQFTSVQALNIPDPLHADPNPLPRTGTEVKYKFCSNPFGKNRIIDFIEDLVSEYGQNPLLSKLSQILQNQTNKKYPSPLAYLISSFLRRYTYVGDTRATTIGQSEYPANGIDIKINLQCTDPSKYFSHEVLKWFLNTSSQTFIVPSRYFTIEDALRDLNVLRSTPDTNVMNVPYGPGGGNLSTTQGFNARLLKQSTDYELLLQNSAGQITSPVIRKYQERLFPKINFLYIAIGRIPSFEAFLPNGTQRIISCNGTPTKNNLDISRGRNQEYVRCFDLVIDIQGSLNYGKTHLTDNQLVGLVNDYINDVYTTVLLKAISSWVGTVDPSLTGTGMPQVASRVSRQDLGLVNYAVFKEPYEEQDVIALFFEMIGRGVFGSSFFRSYGISITETYDGKGLLIPNSQTIFPQVNNDSQLQTIEFKKNASDIIKDFQQGTKDIRSVNLVVCWKYGKFDGSYTLSDVSLVVPSNQRSLTYSKVTKVICDSGGNMLQVLCLCEIRDQLINPQSESPQTQSPNPQSYPPVP